MIVEDVNNFCVGAYALFTRTLYLLILWVWILIDLSNVHLGKDFKKSMSAILLTSTILKSAYNSTKNCDEDRDTGFFVNLSHPSRTGTQSRHPTGSCITGQLQKRVPTGINRFPHRIQNLKSRLSQE